ncbi:hypothetical protein SAMN06298216_1133 [Spirosomataceae bacterium TFI 002]|nr:hypothetical protein SAMN06298216_1133 [Spirosomataceae bacterium TFI 002]
MKRLLGIGSRIDTEEFNRGVVINIKPDGYVVVFTEEGEQKIPLDADFKIVEYIEPEDDMVSFFDIEQSLTSILQKWMGVTETVPLGERWKGGTMILKPKSNELTPKEIPIDTFFHKIVMVRDKLRVMEQKVNSSQLDDEAKVDIQQYISRCYGTMTTFNILFKDSSQHFSSK